MIDPSPAEQNALQAALQSMAQVMAEIGFDVAPVNWTPEQALTVVTAAVDGYQARMQKLLPEDVPF